MPFIDHPKGRAYYRHWAAAEPRATIDQFGHGLSPGTRGDFGSIVDSSDLADTLTELAEGERPGLPLIAQGHSFDRRDRRGAR